MLDKSSVYNILAEGMYFWTQKLVKFHCLSKVDQIAHVIFEIRSQL